MEFLKKKNEETIEKVKVKKITAKDLQAHIRWIDDEMTKCQKDRERYREILSELRVLNKETTAYAELYEEAQLYADADERYSQLQEQKQKEYEVLQKYKNLRLPISIKDLLIICGVTFGAVFAISLERENPKALKLATFLLKLFPVKI